MGCMFNMKYVRYVLFNLIILFLVSPVNVFAADNAQLKADVGLQVKEVLDVWIGIASGAMLLGMIGGAGMIIMSATNERLRTAGKSVVIGSGVSITLLLSTYVIVALILSLFGLSLF